jgi:hypothetical protein
LGSNNDGFFNVSGLFYNILGSFSFLLSDLFRFDGFSK